MPNYSGFKPTTVVGNDYHSDNDLGFKSEVSECFESYHGNGLDLTSNMQDVLTNPTSRQQLVDTIMESVTSSPLFTNEEAKKSPFFNNYAERLTQLLNNSLDTVVRESIITGYSPITAYNPFFLKKAWVDCVFNTVVMTEVPASPVINLAFEHRYVKTLDGTEYEIPDCFYNDDSMQAITNASTGTSILETAIDIASFKPSLNLLSATYFPGFVAGSGAELTHDLHIWKVTMTDASDSNTPHSTYDVPCNIKVDVTTHNFVKGKVSYNVMNGATLVRTLTDNLVGTVDFQSGNVTLMSSTGAVTKVYLRGKLANRWNNHSLSVERRVEELQYTMPESGPRLNTSITIEDAADALALQKIDIISDNVDYMGRTLANLEDFEIRSYLNESYDLQKGATSGPEGYDNMTVEVTFNALPFEGYTGNITTWMKDSREYFERLLAGLKKKLHIQDAVYVAVCHPNTIRFLQDGINWVFTNDTQISGIKLNYNFGVYTSAQDRVHFITSQYMSEDDGIHVLVIPLTNEQITFKHYKYNAVIDRSYLNPLHNLTPNIMCTHRTLTFDVLPVQGKMIISGRDLQSPNTLKRS
jgi:hypothetical protein